MSITMYKLIANEWLDDTYYNTIGIFSTEELAIKARDALLEYKKKRDIVLEKKNVISKLARQIEEGFPDQSPICPSKPIGISTKEFENNKQKAIISGNESDIIFWNNKIKEAIETNRIKNLEYNNSILKYMEDNVNYNKTKDAYIRAFLNEDQKKLYDLDIKYIYDYSNLTIEPCSIDDNVIPYDLEEFL